MGDAVVGHAALPQKFGHKTATMPMVHDILGHDGSSMLQLT